MDNFLLFHHCRHFQWLELKSHEQWWEEHHISENCGKRWKKHGDWPLRWTKGCVSVIWWCRGTLDLPPLHLCSSPALAWLHLCLIFLKIIFYWSIVVLQCSVSFLCTAKWVSSTYTYIPSLLDFLPIQVTTVHEVEFSVLESVFSLVIHFLYSINTVYVSIPISQLITPALSPLVSTHKFPMSVSIFLLCKHDCLCHFPRFHV